MPIGMPGWPDPAASTASIVRARIALAIWACVTVSVEGPGEVMRRGRFGKAPHCVPASPAMQALSGRRLAPPIRAAPRRVRPANRNP